MTRKESSQLNLLHGIILLVGTAMLVITLTMVLCDGRAEEAGPGYILPMLFLMFGGIFCMSYSFFCLVNPGLNTLFSVVIKQGSFAVRKSTNMVEVAFDTDRFFWRWDNPYSDYRLISLRDQKFHELSPYVICADLVRRISCWVEVSPPTDTTSCHVLLHKLELIESGDYCLVNGDPIRSMILEYCEKNAALFKDFYNPYSQTQQADFKALAEEWFTLRLHEFGLKLKNVSFAIAE